MPPSDSLAESRSTAQPVADSWRPRAIDWCGWLLLAWAIGFAGPYARMIVEARAPQVRTVIRHLIGEKGPPRSDLDRAP